MKKAIFSFIIPVAALSLALAAHAAQAPSAEAQTATCPAGYTCTPIAPQPVNCPTGFICTPNPTAPAPAPSGGGSGGGGGVIIPPTPVIPTTNACYTWSTNLTIGSTGADVVALQTWLMGNGFDIPALSQGRAQRGYYGATTAAAVAKYQASIGIPATGFLGALTRAALNGSCTTTNNGLSINLTSSPAPSLSGYAMAYKVTFDGSKYDPADITIELSCSPQYVSWTTVNGETTNPCTNRSDNNAGIDMQRFGDGDYRSTITFFNTSSVPQLIGTVAKAWGGVDGKTLITTDKDAFNLPVSNITPSASCPAGYTCVYTPGTPAQGNCPAGYVCTPTTPVPCL